MGLVALIGIGLAFWLYATRKKRSGWALLPWALALMAGLFAAKGMTVPALAAGAAALAMRMFLPARVTNRPAVTAAVARPAVADVRAAFELLGLDVDVDAEAVKAAHRRLIARTHPDSGGSAALARSINAARDTALAHISARNQERMR